VQGKVPLSIGSIVGKLNFQEKGTRPDIAYATHQCARFSEETRASHEDAGVWLCKYLLATKDDGIIYLRSQTGAVAIEVYADAGFCGSWNKATAPQGISTSKSPTGYSISYTLLIAPSYGPPNCRCRSHSAPPRFYRGGVHFIVPVSEGGDSLDAADKVDE
jgi:hypothetical protein